MLNYFNKFDSTFPYLQSVTLFEWLLKFISRKDFSKKWMITVYQKFTSFNFIMHLLKEVGLI